MWIRRFRLRKKNLGVWGKREQDDLHKSTCHPRGTGKTRVLGKRWENMSEKLECSSHWLNFWETAWYMNNGLVRPRHIGLTNCERKVHILWGPGWATCQDLLWVDSAVILLPELVLQNWKNAQKRLINYQIYYWCRRRSNRYQSCNLGSGASHWCGYLNPWDNP